MLADLDLLLIAVFCTADDLLPEKAENARRSVTDAEVVTLCVAQAMMGIPSDPRFLAVAAKRLAHLFPRLPKQPGFHKRRRRLSDTIEALIAEFARHSLGFDDDLLLVDSTPVECARSRETVKRAGDSRLADALADAADYGYCASHSRFFWGFRLHVLFAPDGTPRALALTSPKRDEREVAVEMLARAGRGGETLIGDKGYAGQAFEAEIAALNAQILRPQPPRRTRPPRAPPRPDPPARRVDLLDRERHPHPRTPRRPHALQPPRAARRPLPRAHRRDRPQPQTRPTQPRPRRLHRLTRPRNNSSRESWTPGRWGSGSMAAISPCRRVAHPGILLTGVRALPCYPTPSVENGCRYRFLGLCPGRGAKDPNRPRS
jgi:Transposase DDE domain